MPVCSASTPEPLLFCVILGISGEAIAGPGKTLIIIGLIIVAVGVIFSLAGKVPWLGKLPGDFYIKRENFTFYFPLATSIIISIILSLILWLLRK
jgi:hypothetical protein